jgi:hypothetical protein
VPPPLLCSELLQMLLVVWLNPSHHYQVGCLQNCCCCSVARKKLIHWTPCFLLHSDNHYYSRKAEWHSRFHVGYWCWARGRYKWGSHVQLIGIEWLLIRRDRLHC